MLPGCDAAAGARGLFRRDAGRAFRPRGSSRRADRTEAGDTDDTLRVALLCGGAVVERHELCKKVEISWDGPVRDLRSDFSVSCGDMQGSVTCDNVGDNVRAGSDVSCCGGSIILYADDDGFSFYTAD